MIRAQIARFFHLFFARVTHVRSQICPSVKLIEKNIDKFLTIFTNGAIMKKTVTV